MKGRLLFAATWVNREDITLSDMSQTRSQKDEYCRSPVT